MLRRINVSTSFNDSSINLQTVINNGKKTVKALYSSKVDKNLEKRSKTELPFFDTTKFEDQQSFYNIETCINVKFLAILRIFQVINGKVQNAMQNITSFSFKP